MLKSAVDYWERAAKLYPSKSAYIDAGDKATYKELRDGALKIAAYLVNKGVAPKTPVIVFMDKEVVAIRAIAGVTYSAGIYTPFDVHAPIERLNKIVNFLKPCKVLTDKKNTDKARELSIEHENLLYIEDALAYSPSEAEEKEVARRDASIIDTDPLYIICTSGSTGIPKGVVIPHRAVIDFTEEASEVMEFSEKEVFANQAPFYFDASVPDLYCTVRNGATLHILDAEMYKFPIRVLEYIRDNGINAIYWVPSALILTANMRALGTTDISCLKKVMFCGEVMPTKQYNIWKKHLPDAKYVNYYGPSETTYASTYYVIDREFTNDQTLPIGKPAINTGVIILTDDNREAGPDEIGELCIKGSGLALGYYNNPEKTNAAFMQNPLNTLYEEKIYRTGDLVRLNEYGEIEYVCRKDFQIKHMGYRIELGEIEAAAGSVDGVSRVCCMYNNKRQEIVIVYEGAVDETTLKETLKAKVPEYMVPGKAVKLDEMPMNANGKVDRVKLAETYAPK